MPVNACADFCRDGFSFVRSSFEEHGSPLRAFAPDVVWHGTCLSGREDHLPVCEAHFHNRRFSIPRECSRALLVDVSDTAHASFVRCVSRLGDAVYYGVFAQTKARVRQWRHHIRTLLDNLSDESVIDAAVARRCLGSWLVSRDVALKFIPGSGTFEDKHWCEVYRRWLAKTGPMPRGHHALTDACVDSVLLRIPYELRVLVRRRVYSNCH